MSLRPWFIVPLLGAALARGQDDLPRHAPGETLDFEPKLMLDGPHAIVSDSPPPASPDDRVQQLENSLRIAEQRAADSEQLFKEGIIAKVEAEGRALRVVRARKELADARLIVAGAHLDAIKKAFAARQASQADLDDATAALKAARDASAAASSEWENAQVAAAAVDLQRKRKLYAEGVATRREVELAEDRLVLLSGTAPSSSPPP